MELENIKNYCFICGKEISEKDIVCSHCGYQRIIEDTCPRLVNGICIHTNDFCVKGINYYNCEILRRFD